MEIQALLEFNEISEQWKFMNYMDMLIDNSIKKDYFIEKYGFSIPNETALELIKKYSPILEVFSGKGYWASLLKQLNCDIIATDNYRWNYKPEFTDVLNYNSIDAVRNFRNRNLLMSWPPYNKPDAFDTIKEFNDQFFIYIGEGNSGCCADSDFFTFLDDNYKLIETVSIPNWPLIHDSLFVYENLNFTA
jgi:hypothetical protein